MTQSIVNVKSNVSPAVAKASAERYVELLAGSADAKVCWRVFSDQGDSFAKNFTGPLAEVGSDLHHFQADKCGVFMIVNGGGHKDMHVKNIRAVFIDADDTSLPDEWHEEPDFLVIRDEAHFHAFWLTDGFTVEQFTEVQRRLAKFYGTDPCVHNPSRVMRCPGFLHQKGDPIRVTLKENYDRTEALSGSEVERRGYDTLTTFLPELTEAEMAAGEHGTNPMRHVPPAEGEDMPSSIEKAERYLAGRAPAIAKQGNGPNKVGGNRWTYETACGTRDYGISAAMCAQIIYQSEWNAESEPPWGIDELTMANGPVDNAYDYGQNRSGQKASALLKSGRLKETAVAVDDYTPTSYANDNAKKANGAGTKEDAEELDELAQIVADIEDCPPFERNRDGSTAKSFRNAVMAVKALEPVPEYDEFHARAVIRKDGNTLPVEDSSFRSTRMEIIREWGLELSKENVSEAMLTVADQNRFHPVKDHFESLEWDGTKRLDTWLSDYFGVENTEYTRAVGRLWLLAGVTRIYKPGCKFDFMLVLLGLQGVSKSKALRALSIKPEWFSDNPPSDLRPDNKDAVMLLQGKLIVEHAELDSLKKTARGVLKSFLSRQIDEMRVPYGRVPQQFPRQCIFAGSGNERSFLEDPTGARRFWPVEVPEGHRVDVDGLVKVVEQLWAEAKVAYDAGEKPALPERLWAAAGQAQEDHHAHDPWEDKLRTFLGRSISRGEGHEDEEGVLRDKVHTMDLLDHALDIPNHQQTTEHGRRLRPLMEDRIGWKYERGVRIGTEVRAGYVKKGVLPDEQD